MRRPASALLVLGLVLLLHLPAAAQIQLPQSVVANGGDRQENQHYLLEGTVGQAVIGVVSDPSSYRHEIGFWPRALWIITGVAESEEALPIRFWLGENYPNPFNPLTTLEFAIPVRSRVTMKLYDVSGREVRTLADEEMDPGQHKIILQASGLSSGVYYFRMTAGTFVQTRKVALIK
jgi:hypothetical protein